MLFRKLKRQFESTASYFCKVRSSVQVLVNTEYLEHNLFATRIAWQLDMDDQLAIDEDVKQVLSLFRDMPNYVDVLSDGLQSTPQTHQEPL
ncbi:hypothetical protein A6452_27905 [Bradyrhizobium elkanii]|nr:hypothetical protein A6452_27905 [Bradyrhizobium elkanii]